ncbi:MAG: CHAT domain-containing protein [Verrucomicrobia bacterium]|nr:CHAT domain-containing protein [Verrucomicrobiota bacterium]
MTSDSGHVPPPSAILPLPKGDLPAARQAGGRGEGEGRVQIPESAARSPEPPPAATFAELSSRGTELGRLREIERRDFGELSLPPLPGTARESAALAEKARQWNWPTELHLAAEASEAQLKATRSPRILHLATHGFFLPEEEPKAAPFGEAAFNLLSPHSFESALRTPHSALDDWRGVGGIRPELSLSQSGPFGLPGVPSLGSFGFRLGLVKNPMHRSGLALAGAQATLEAWRRGEAPPPDNDGIVTAADVGTLDLKGTWLVTLSACDTGAGEVRTGEGVLGLRRAFIQAGAENLLMTLWPIADEETAQFMVEFYEAAHRSGDAPCALWEVQRDWLVKLRAERSLQAAVSLAGPFVMTSQSRR